MRIETISVVRTTPDMRNLLYFHLYQPWGVAHDCDWLCRDDGGEFLVAYDEQNALQGMIRVMPKGVQSGGHVTPVQCEGERNLRQFVVSPERRGVGIGSLLLRAAEEQVSQGGSLRVGFASRQSAYRFYQNRGYLFFGEEYLSTLTGIPHRHMSKLL